MSSTDSLTDISKGPLIYRQNRWTRSTHWIWAACLFFLLLTGLQIFNAHPTLYIGKESGFAYNNVILSIDAVQEKGAPKGVTEDSRRQVQHHGRFWRVGPGRQPAVTALFRPR